MIELDMRTKVMLSIQRALWDMVTPDLRGVAVSWGDNFVGARFIYDRVVDDDIWEIVQEVETYVLSDFLPGLVTEFTMEHVSVDEPRLSRDDEWWVYLRKED